MKNWPSELFFWIEETSEAIVKQLEALESLIEKNKDLSLHDLAYKIYLENSKKQTLNRPMSHRTGSGLAIVADSLDEFKEKLKSAKESLKQHADCIRDSKGIYFSSKHIAKDGKIAFLFSGQGSQRPNMFKDLKALFPQMQESISKADTVLKERLPKLLSGYIFPALPSGPEEEQLQMKELTETNIAQPALGAVEAGLLKIMQSFGINADMLAGHSLGEYVALYAGGVFEEKTLYELLEYRGSAIKNSSKDGNLGTLPTSQQAGMLAVGAGVEDIKEILKEDVYPVRNRSPLGDRTEMPEALPISNGVYVANLNSPRQTILSGGEKVLDLAGSKLKEKGFRSKKINVSCAFHSPYMMPARNLLFEKLTSLDYKAPVIPVYSNLSAGLYPKDKQSILSILSEHLTSSVKFTDEVENMFKDGAKIFLEIGPGNVLTNLVKQILADREYLALPCNMKTTSDISQILNVLAQLVAEGFKVNLSALFDDR